MNVDPAEKEAAESGVARALTLLEELFAELACLGIDPLQNRALKAAADELTLEAMRVSMRFGISSLPRMEYRAEWTIGELRQGLAEIAQRLSDCRRECSARAGVARARHPR